MVIAEQILLLTLVLLVLYYAIQRVVNFLDALGEHIKGALRCCGLVLLCLSCDVEVATFCRAVDHACLAVKNAPLFLLLDPSVSVEFGAELDLDLDLGVGRLECLLSQLDAKLVLSSILGFVLILHVRVHITVEKLLALSVCQHEPHTLVRGATSVNQFVVRPDQLVKDTRVKHLDLHLERVIFDNGVRKAAPFSLCCIEIHGVAHLHKHGKRRNHEKH